MLRLNIVLDILENINVCVKWFKTFNDNIIIYIQTIYCHTDVLMMLCKYFIIHNKYTDYLIWNQYFYFSISAERDINYTMQIKLLLDSGWSWKNTLQPSTTWKIN